MRAQLTCEVLLILAAYAALLAVMLAALAALTGSIVNGKHATIDAVAEEASCWAARHVRSLPRTMQPLPPALGDACASMRGAPWEEV